MKLLAISFAFPPVIAPRAIQVARLLRHVDADCAVVCGLDVGEATDPTLEPHAEAAMAICRRVQFRRRRWVRRADAVASLARIPLWNCTPDVYRGWVEQATAAARTVVADGFSPDVLVTFGNPMSDHLVGLRLHRGLQIPWLAHFSDPWVRNPFHRSDPLTHYVNRRLERAVHESATTLAFPSDECADYMLVDVPMRVRAKRALIAHSFDDSGAPGALPAPSGPIVIRHVGSLYGLRTPAPLIAGLERLYARSPEALSHVRVEFVGLSDRGSVAGTGLPPGMVTVLDRVPYEESRRLMRESDGLLVMDGAWSGPGIFFPSKLADYLGSGSPVMAIANSGACARIVRAAGGVVAPVADPVAMAECLDSFLTLLRQRRAVPAPWGDAAARQAYSAPVVGARFTQLLQDALGA